MKKVVFVANTSWFLYNFRSDIMLYMKEQGYDVFAVAPRDNYSPKIEQNSIRFIEIKIDRKGKNIINDFLLTLKLKRIYKELNPMVIHHFTIKPAIYGTIAARMAGVPRVANSITGLGHVFIKRSLVQLFVKRLYKAAFSSNKIRVIFENPDDMKTFLSNNIISKEQAFLIYGNGVDSKIFSPDNPDISFPPDIKKDANCVIFSLFARMIWDKGIREFVEAAKLIWEKSPNTRFYLFGGIDDGNPAGVPRGWLEKISKEPYVEWIDHVDNVRPYIKLSDVIVLPSAYREGVPQSLIEAALMSRPIITTDIPGCRDIVVNEKNGLIVPIKDSHKLAEAMSRLIKNPSLRDQMGKAGREHALRQFDSEIVIRRTTAVYFNP